MDSYKLPLEKTICDKINPKCYDFLVSFGVTHILDVDTFTSVRGYQPCVSSIFLYGNGGSYSFMNEEGRQIFVHNGTLAIPETISFSNEYLEILRKKK